ncbi:MAG: 1-deoxy-D-xylulose-5-phosphate reductoisomerase [Clostridiales bacterium]|nr:1-deoxy-D-xylulose-5-phosphate reductoisomerase [Clostridiales bacterium]
MRRKYVLLGSTGSVGRQAVDTAIKMQLEVTALACGGKSLELFCKQCKALQPKLAAVHDKNATDGLRELLKGYDIRIVSGDEGVIEAASFAPGGIVLTAMVGMRGLRPTLAAIEAGSDIALANKETLVCAGDLVMKKARERGVKILPVDSEHSAVFQCIEGRRDELKKIILTASGGPFFGKTYEEVYGMTSADALKHPTWEMGEKITVDCATLMNKGLEFIEAMRLFDVSPDMIDILIHRESVIHSMVELRDNSVIAQLGTPDMRLPIQYAFTYPERAEYIIPALDLAARGSLTFAKPDYDTFKSLKLAKEVAKWGGSMCTALNGANEAAVECFLRDEISFGMIGDTVERVLEKTDIYPINSLEDALSCDRESREAAIEVLSRHGGV